MLRALLLSGSLLALAACQEDSGDPLDGGGQLVGDAAPSLACEMMTPPTSCPDNPPRYAKVAPIFERYCSGCHGKDWTGAWPLDTYDHVADWADVVQLQLLSCAMPPADAGALPEELRNTIVTWVGCGAPK